MYIYITLVDTEQYMRVFRLGWPPMGPHPLLNPMETYYIFAYIEVHMPEWMSFLVRVR